jgi:mannose-6-phosphate isomerase-like protein (cupin superfamily)
MGQSRRSDHVRADGGTVHLTPWGERSAVKVTGAQTGGAFTVTELITDSAWRRPAYVHHELDECCYVVDGAFEARLDDRSPAVPLRPGDVLFIPRGVQRSLRSAWPGTGRLLLIGTPGHAPDPTAPLAGIEFVVHPVPQKGTAS